MASPSLPSSTLATLAVRGAAWALLAAVLVMTLGQIGLRPVTGHSAGFERFAAFAVIGGLFGLAYPRRWPMILALVIGSAAALEILQELAPGRHGRLADFAVKAVGGLCGIAAAAFVNRQAGR